MRRVLLVLLLLWALCGMAQYGPGEGGYGDVALQFSGRLISPGSCFQEARDRMRCQVPVGQQGTIELAAAVSPPRYRVGIAAVSLPPWASFRPVSREGRAETTCTFIPPSGAAGDVFELRFRASTVGGLTADLVVVLEVMGTGGEVGPGTTTVPAYTTDPQGKFSVAASELPSTYVTGTLTRCGNGPLGGIPITVRLIPAEGKTSIRSFTDIGAVEISSPGYGTVTVPKEKLRFLSSMDITGRVQRTIDVGTVCLTPSASGTTDSQGRFSVSVDYPPNTTVAGVLTRCTVRPLAGVPVQVTLIPKAGRPSIRNLGDVGAVRISTPYGEAMITDFKILSSMDIHGRVSRTIDVGEVCLGMGEVPYTVPVTPGAVYGETGDNGELSVSLDPKTRVSGRLTECDSGSPLAGVAVRLTPLYEGDRLIGFEIAPEGYPPKTVTEILRLSLFNVTTYNLGEVCFGPPIGEAGCREVSLKVLSLNAQRLTANAKAVAAREQEIMKFIKKGGSFQFDIVCFQEWFQDVDAAGITGLRAWSTDKGPLIRHWIGARPDLEEVKIGGQEVRGIRLINAYPNNYGAEIIFGSNYVAGPDCTRFLETRLDGGLVILVKPPYKIVAASAFLFSSGEDWDANASKGALYARVQLDPDNPDCYIHVFNTHLQADYPGKSYAHIRKTQIEELTEFMEKCTADDQVGHPIVLAGDFNIVAPRPRDWGKNLIPPEGLNVNTQNPTRSNEYAFLEQQLRNLGLKDAWSVLRGNDPGFTWIGKDWKTKFPSPWGNLGNALATADGWPARLDYIFVSSGNDKSPINLRLVKIQRSPESTGPKTMPYRWRHDGGWLNSFTLSDHLGLILEAEVK